MLTGPRTGRELEASYAASDVLVHPSRGETYGMVVTEALARALPVLAPRVGGAAEALGVTPDGRRPGCFSRPVTSTRSPARCGAGSATRCCAATSATQRVTGGPA